MITCAKCGGDNFITVCKTCNSQPLTLPIKSEAERTNEALLNRIEDAIRSYKLSFTEPEDETGSFHIVDALTPPGDDNIKRGEEELDLLVDAVLAEVEEALSAKDAEKAVVQEELKEAQHHIQFSMTHRCDAPITFLEGDGTERHLEYDAGDSSVGINSGYIPADNKWEALTSKLKIAEKALVKLGRFKLGSFGDMFLNDIIDSALKSIRGDEGVK